MNYLAAIKDLVLVVAIISVGWFVYHSGKNADQLKIQQAIQQQLEANLKQEERWHNEALDAFAEENSSIAAIHSHIDAQRKPIVVQVPSPSPLPGHPSTSKGDTPASGGSHETAGVDIRPGINGYEKWVEDNLGTCRAVLESWPH